jgi:4-amino-4-deoxy-L-arabinose transferase-like glycosyltransferase
MQGTTPEQQPVAWRVLGGIALFKLALHLYTNLFAGYGIFRDELYYLACARHLAAGYVDHPPLSMWVLALARAVLGESAFAIRLLPAILGAATVLVVGLLARQMGGGRFAQGLAAAAATVSLIVIGYNAVYSMNALDLLLAALAVYALVRLIDSGRPRWWVALGLVFGLGLLNKVGMLWIALGVFVSVLLTRERRWLATRWPWIGGAVAWVLFMPYVVWNATQDWAHLEFIRRAVGSKYSGLDAWDFLSNQLTINNPVTLPIWLAGLVFLLSPAGRRYRAVGIVFVTAALVLVINGHSKSEYLASAFSGIFAAGGVAWERWLEPSGRRWLRAVLVALLAPGLVLAPINLPILPVETYIRYASALGIQPSTAESKELAELPQFYADMFGWEEKAAAAAEVYQALPTEERRVAAIFGENYGRAGAIDYYGPRYGLPPAIGSHNNYWLWGPGEASGEVVIFVGASGEWPARFFESFEQAGVARCDYCMPYEKDIPIWVARGLKDSVEETWVQIGHYE